MPTNYFELGFILWTRMNAADAMSQGLYWHTYRTELDKSQITTLSGHDIAYFEQLGKEHTLSRSLAGPSAFTRRNIDTGDNKLQIWIFAPYGSEDSIDGTVPWDDFETRYSRGPSYNKNNSCAFDCVWMILNWGKVATTANGQVREKFNNLSATAKVVVYEMCQKYDGNIRLINSSRNRLKDHLIASIPLQPDGSLHPVDRILDACFSTLPYVSFTTIRALVGCEKVTLKFGTVKPTVTCRSQIMITIGGQVTVQAAAQAWFDGILQASTPCDNPSCDHKVKIYANLVLDRLPKLLRVTLNGRHSPNPTMFVDIKFKYYVLTHVNMVSYRFVGVLLCVNESHFVVRWNGASFFSPSILHYDGMMQKGKTELVQNWMSAIADTTVVALFFKQDTDSIIIE